MTYEVKTIYIWQLACPQKQWEYINVVKESILPCLILCLVGTIIKYYMNRCRDLEYNGSSYYLVCSHPLSRYFPVHKFYFHINAVFKRPYIMAQVPGSQIGDLDWSPVSWIYPVLAPSVTSMCGMNQHLKDSLLCSISNKY